MTVDAGQVEWLKEAVKWATATDAGVAAAWGADALETEVITCLALAADAATEAGRQQAFMEGPLAVETHDVAGQRADLFCRPVTITADRLGYDAGVAVFVIGYDETSKPGRTILTVLRRLA